MLKPSGGLHAPMSSYRFDDCCGGAAQASKHRDDARTKWRTVHDHLERAGDLIAQRKLDEAVAWLKRLEQELPEPYRVISRDVLNKFREKFAEIKAIERGDAPLGPDDPSQVLNDAELARLCRQLHAYGAASNSRCSASESGL